MLHNEVILCYTFGMKALSLAHKEATREGLLTLAKQIPGAWIGIKIAALLLVLEGQRPGWINALFGLSGMTLERWIRGVNQEGVQALKPKPRPGRPTRLTYAMQQQLEQHLEKTLVVHLKESFGVKLKVRQAQEWLHRLGYSLKRASYVYLQANAEDSRSFQRKLKKTAQSPTQ